MSKALYRKYRSKSLDEVIGQKHITDILSQAIKQGRISHAYLLTGPRGVGKTSVARILAHEINNLIYDEEATNLDIIEIDAASNNGVEDVRDLREKVQIAPVSAKKKVYIIDEVHMLSKAAFNALLKTLEEPPEHIVFILATTNVEKLPATIISRTQRFSFRPIQISDAVKHLSYIANQESIKITDGALELIAKRSDGSFRDSISLLDQLSNLIDAKNDTITIELIENLLGLTSNNTVKSIIKAVESHDSTEVIRLVNDAINSGINSTSLVDQLINSICEQAGEKPNLLSILDSLIDVTKSPQPHLKLISVLGMAAAKQHSKSIGLSAPVYEVSASIKELEKEAIKVRPNEKKIIEKIISKSTEKITSSKTDNNSVDIENHENTVNLFDWAKFIEHTRRNYIAIYSVISKCAYEVSGSELTIYTGSKFYKNKLDDIKYAPLLSKSLQDIGVFGMNITTIPSSIPPSDSQAAAIAAIMGGGVEVSLENV